MSLQPSLNTEHLNSLLEPLHDATRTPQRLARLQPSASPVRTPPCSANGCVPCASAVSALGVVMARRRRGSSRRCNSAACQSGEGSSPVSGPPFQVDCQAANSTAIWPIARISFPPVALPRVSGAIISFLSVFPSIAIEAAFTRHFSIVRHALRLQCWTDHLAPASQPHPPGGL